MSIIRPHFQRNRQIRRESIHSTESKKILGRCVDVQGERKEHCIHHLVGCGARETKTVNRSIAHEGASKQPKGERRGGGEGMDVHINNERIRRGGRQRKQIDGGVNDNRVDGEETEENGKHKREGSW